MKSRGIAVVAVLVFGVAIVDSATAGTPVTNAASWTVTSTAGVTETFAEETIECSKTAASGNFVLNINILGLPVHLQATGAKCPGARIKSVKVGAENMALVEGKVTFTGIKVTSPSECTTPTTNETKALVADLRMDKSVGTKSFLRFEPAAGAAGTFTSVKIENCSIAGTYPAKGVVYAEATNPTEVHSITQEFANNETTVAMSTLKFGEEAGGLTGEIAIELAGAARKGKAWGAEPK